MRMIFKNRILIHQSMANLDEKILLGKMIYHLDPQIRTTLVKGISGNEGYTFFKTYFLLKLNLYF